MLCLISISSGTNTGRTWFLTSNVAWSTSHSIEKCLIPVFILINSGFNQYQPGQSFHNRPMTSFLHFIAICREFDSFSKTTSHDKVCTSRKLACKLGLSRTVSNSNRHMQVMQHNASIVLDTVTHIIATCFSYFTTVNFDISNDCLGSNWGYQLYDYMDKPSWNSLIFWVFFLTFLVVDWQVSYYLGLYEEYYIVKFSIFSEIIALSL